LRASGLGSFVGVGRYEEATDRNRIALTHAREYSTKKKSRKRSRGAMVMSFGSGSISQHRSFPEACSRFRGNDGDCAMIPWVRVSNGTHFDPEPFAAPKGLPIAAQAKVWGHPRASLDSEPCNGAHCDKAVAVRESHIRTALRSNGPSQILPAPGLTHEEETCH